MKITARDILGDSRAEGRNSASGSGAFPGTLQAAFSGEGTSLANLPILDHQGVDFLVKVVQKAMVQAKGGPFSLPGHMPMGMVQHRQPHPELMVGRDIDAAPGDARDVMAATPRPVASLPPSAVPRPESVRTMAPASYDGIIQKAAAAHGVDPDLVAAVVRTESSFNPKATSPAGAMGLMQLMPGTARELGVSDPYDPEQNVMGGTKYLKQLLQRYHGRKELALAAYNWGPGNMERHPQEMPRETRNYVTKVMGLMAEGGPSLA